MIATLRQAPIQLQPNFSSNRRTAAAKRAYIHRSSAQAEVVGRGSRLRADGS